MRNNVSLKFEGQIKHKNKQRYGEAGELVNKSETNIYLELRVERTK